MTKIICIDSFKPSYLEYAPFLSSLTKNYQHGELKVPIGFWGGMETFFKGESNTLAFYYHSIDSSLRWTKRFTFLGRRILEIIINLQRLFRNQRQFFLTHNIPLKELYKFESAVKREFTQDADCDYIHIGELDGIAHKYGTKANETINCIKRIDNKLSKMDFDVVMSDHGMVDVKEVISVHVTRNCFIDSVMARYWGECPKLPKNKGKLIKTDKKWGDYVFLVKPGILISPNFWSKNPVKAMHGYELECNGFYIIKKNGSKINLTMKQLHDLIFL